MVGYTFGPRWPRARRAGAAHFFAVLWAVAGLGTALLAGFPPDWRFATPLPQGNDLRAAWAGGPDDLYVGGHGGVLLHWDGQTWRSMTTSTTKTIFAMHGLSAADIWAVGGDAYTADQTNRSLVLHYNGQSWTELPAPNFGGTTYVLQSVHAIAANDVWATADLSTWPAHWDGQSWQFVPHALPLEGQLLAVTAVGPDHVFFSGTHGQLVHRDQGAWRLEQKAESGSFSVNLLQALWAYDLDNIYAGGSWGQVYQRNSNGTWQDLGFPTGLFSDNGVLHIWGTSPTNVYLLGVTAIRHYTGQGVPTTNNFASQMRRQWFTGAGAGDRLYGVGPNGVAHEYRLDGQGGGALSALTAGGEADLNLRILGATACGAAGVLLYGDSVYRQEAVPLLYFDGGQLHRFPALPPGMKEQAVVSAALANGLEDVVIAWNNLLTFERGVHRWNGVAWEPWGSLGSSPSEAVAFWQSPTGILYACGPSRVVRWDGTNAWTEFYLVPPAEPDTILNAIWGRSDQELYLGTKNGKILRYDGNGWVPETTPATGVIRGISGNAADVYAVGDNALAWRRVNGTWQRLNGIELRGGEDFAAIIAARDGVYAAQSTPAAYTGGGLGLVWRFNGATATPILKGLSQPLVALATTGQGYLYGFAPANFIVTDAPTPNGTTLQRLDLSVTNWTVLGSSGVALRPAVARSGSAVVAAWRLDEPAPLFAASLTNAVVQVGQYWAIRQETFPKGSALPPAYLSLTYDPGRLPADFAAASAHLYRHVGAAWSAVPGWLDPVAHTLTTTSPTTLSSWTIGSTRERPAPPLAIAVSGTGRILVSWPSTGAGFQLEGVAALPGPATWTPVSQSPQFDPSNALYRVALDVGAAAQFYRLRR